jgi:hypothetical protein
MSFINTLKYFWRYDMIEKSIIRRYTDAPTETILKYISPKSLKSIKYIILADALGQGIDIDKFYNDKFDGDQVIVLMKFIKNDFPIDNICFGEITWESMNKLYNLYCVADQVLIDNLQTKERLTSRKIQFAYAKHFNDMDVCPVLVSTVL